MKPRCSISGIARAEGRDGLLFLEAFIACLSSIGRRAR
jgi:hypothetical protein